MVYENVDYGDVLGHVLMFDVDTDSLIGCAQLFQRLRELCEIWDLNGYLFKTDNGFHFVATNIIDDKSELLKMFAFLYPYVDDKAFAFGIINEEWHLRLSKKPNGKPITFVHDFLYGEPDTLNSEAHFDLLNRLSKFSRLNIPLHKPKGIMVVTDFGFTTYPLWK
jgi:hypothetical protein